MKKSYASPKRYHCRAKDCHKSVCADHMKWVNVRDSDHKTILCTNCYEKRSKPSEPGNTDLRIRYEGLSDKMKGLQWCGKWCKDEDCAKRAIQRDMWDAQVDANGEPVEEDKCICKKTVDVLKWSTTLLPCCRNAMHTLCLYEKNKKLNKIWRMTINKPSINCTRCGTSIPGEVIANLFTRHSSPISPPPKPARLLADELSVN